MDIKTKPHAELVSTLEAIDRVQAVIWFTPDGTIIEANENFCGALGYSAEEIIGKHHRMFCESGFAQSPKYKAM